MELLASALQAIDDLDMRETVSKLMSAKNKT